MNLYISLILKKFYVKTKVNLFFKAVSFSHKERRAEPLPHLCSLSTFKKAILRVSQGQP